MPVKKGQVINPTGKGGFQERPEDRSSGTWKKEMVFSYQYRRFMNMTTAQLKEYSSKPDTERTVVEDLAYSRVIAAKRSLPDVKEMTDRTEGKSPQAIDLTSSDGSMTPTVIIESVYGNKPNFRPDNQVAEADNMANGSSPESS